MQRRRDDLVGIPLDPSPVLRIFLGYRLASRRCLQEEHPMTNRLLVIITAIVAVVGFGTATFLYEPTATQPAANPTAQDNFLVRDHSPILGPPDAPVPIVEFFAPACEDCRVFPPVGNKQLRTSPGRGEG